MITPRDGLILFLIVGLVTLAGNWAGFDINPLDAVVGMLILLAFVFVGWWLSKNLPIDLPPIIFVSLIAILASTPWTPGSEWVLSHVNNVSFLATCTPVLAYAGISIGSDLDAFIKLGWRIVVVSLVVLTGTFIFSGAIAHVLLKVTGQI